MADMWHIVQGGQRQTTQLNPSGTGFTDVWEITYQVDSGPAQGTQGTFRIAQEMYNADNVKAGIDAAVAELDRVAGL